MWYTERVEEEMIDEYWTFMFYGYYSDELTPQSANSIVARCDECCQYRVLRYNSYRDLCIKCVHTKKYITNETRHNLCKARKGTHLTKEHKLNISKGNKGKKRPPRTDEWRHKQSIAQSGNSNGPHTEKTKQKISATHQGIPYEEWVGFSNEASYCEKFDEACRERIREKYNYKCFVCNKHQDKNITKTGKHNKLSVHHVDMNKDQGCNGNEWKLVTLCMSCHSKAHGEPMKSRIEYISQ